MSLLARILSSLPTHLHTMAAIISNMRVATRYHAKTFYERHSPFEVVNANKCNLSRALLLTTRNIIETSGHFPQRTARKDFNSTTAVASRSRKRPRPWKRHRQQGGSLSSVTGSEIDDGSNDFKASPSKNDKEAEDDLSLPYPKGKPWRVLWPHPHGLDSSDLSWSNFHQRIPTIRQIRRAWSLYKETWEDGIQGVPDKRKDSNEMNDDSVESAIVPSITQQQLEDIGENASKNLQIVRKDSQDLLEHTKNTTGIHTQDDAKALAAEAMKVATDCIREFMSGYREGRDSEIDKMLHEYFQDEEEGNDSGPDNQSILDNSDNVESTTKTASNTAASTRRGKKRKPKRGIPRS